jgi:putative transposase
MRKYPLVNNHVYHVVTRSIAKYKVFNNPQDFVRMTDMLRLYRYQNFTIKYSIYSRQSADQQKAICKNLLDSPKSVEIIAYCIMPTHLHLVIKQLADKGISKYIAKALNSYTRYFNCVHKRKGPLWEGKFRNILVDDNDQLLHLTRYIHLNPSSAGLVDAPEEWDYSSYRAYISRKKDEDTIASYSDLIDIFPSDYRKFVRSRITYQRQLSRIKSILLENYIG